MLGTGEGQVNHRHLFLTAQSPEVRAQGAARQRSGEGPSWVPAIFSQCPHGQEGPRELSGVPFLRALTPFTRAPPPRPHHLPQHRARGRFDSGPPPAPAWHPAGRCWCPLGSSKPAQRGHPGRCPSPRFPDGRLPRGTTETRSPTPSSRPAHTQGPWTPAPAALPSCPALPGHGLRKPARCRCPGGLRPSRELCAPRPADAGPARRTAPAGPLSRLRDRQSRRLTHGLSFLSSPVVSRLCPRDPWGPDTRTGGDPQACPNI